MAASQRRFFKRPESPKPENNKQSQLDDLKKQLTTIQSKIEGIEGEEKEDEFEVKTLHQWTSASHVFIPRGKKWLTYIALITSLIILVILFAQQFLIIAPVLAVAFLAYVLASVPPDGIEHRITTQGLITGKHNYLWEELYDFWFIEKQGHIILNFDTLVRFPGRLMLIIDSKEKDKIKNILVRFLPFREVPEKTWIDSLGDSLSNFFHKIAS